jgi:hypothetical protein
MSQDALIGNHTAQGRASLNGDPSGYEVFLRIHEIDYWPDTNLNAV